MAGEWRARRGRIGRKTSRCGGSSIGVPLFVCLLLSRYIKEGRSKARYVFAFITRFAAVGYIVFGELSSGKNARRGKTSVLRDPCQQGRRQPFFYGLNQGLPVSLLSALSCLGAPFIDNLE